MSILTKPIVSEQSNTFRSSVLKPTQTQVPGNNPGFARVGISIVVTCVVLNISKKGEISVVIVKRKYHPFEDYWSLPFAMLNDDETRLTGAARCVRDSLGIRKKIDFIQYEMFDNVDRSPFGRVVACGMIGIHYGENMHLSAGGLASEIKLTEVRNISELVYDHNLIFNTALRYIYRIRNNFSFIKELFPDNIPLKYIRELLREVRDFEHRRKEREHRPGIFDR